MRIPLLATALALVGLSGASLLRLRGEPPASSRPPVPVILELFSSEGCSSCPPADAYLAALDRDQPIDGVTVLALEVHVDYWDRLGWRDPFGSPAFGDRQGAYARVLTGGRVFTPELVVDGRLVMPGADEDAGRTMLRAAAREPRARVTLQREGARIAVDATDIPPAGSEDPAEVLLAVTESGLASDVRTGENAGRRLAHAPVVRSLRSLGRTSGPAVHGDTALELDPRGKAGALRFVAIVQRARSRTIVGAGAL
jgi:hypothetical protein